MDFIREIKAFELLLQTVYLPPLAQLLWYKLFMLFNGAGWPEWVVKENVGLMGMIGLSNEKSFIRYRNMLIDAGLIEYQKGRKGFPNRYKLISICTCNSPVQMTVETPVQMTVETPALYKQKLKQKLNKEKGTNVPQKKFTSPTIDEVSSYCSERNNRVDASRFVDFYASKGWMVGKNKMKDWKAAVRTWEKGEAKNQRNDSGSDNVFFNMLREEGKL